MTVPDRIRILLASLVYVTAIFLGGSFFVSDPTDVPVAVPGVSGLLLVFHAARTGHLDELGYAVIGMWAGVLAASVGSGVVERVVLSGRPSDIEVSGATAVLSITALLVAGYVLALNRGRKAGRASPRS